MIKFITKTVDALSSDTAMKVIIVMSVTYFTFQIIRVILM